MLIVDSHGKYKSLYDKTATVEQISIPKELDKLRNYNQI